MKKFWENNPGLETLRDRWLGVKFNRYGTGVLIFSIIAALSPVLVGLASTHDSFKDHRPTFAVIGIIASLLALLFGNANKYETKSIERTDSDGLIKAMESTLTNLHVISHANPEDEIAKLYVRNVLEHLRTRLEPVDNDRYVRVCLYRRDQEEQPEARDGFESENFDNSDDHRTVQFNLYGYARGERVDTPRRFFRDDAEPGDTFMSQIFETGRYACESTADMISDNLRYPELTSRKYNSFVNIALQRENGETYAMLTCDSIQESFFDERRERLIRVFSKLISVALTQATTVQMHRPLKLHLN
ncbi:hypothetical protein [Corynebacterium glutamicum]|uniref:hypothetical protein n=1 Tax=Corynebacterium glutamicum TaxID=1718 RepID=UPI001B8D02BC|nr:hypothetical protein [Corynebacterium glutamicum]